MARLEALVAAGGVAIFMAGACSSFGAADHDGTDGGADGNGIIPSETPIADPVDAGPAEAGAFCKTVDATLCRDFDAVNGPFEGWSGKRVSAGGSVALDTSSSTSAPASLRVGLPATPTEGASTYAYVEQRFAVTGWPLIRSEFDVRFQRADWQTGHRNVGIASIFLNAGSSTHRVYLVVSYEALHVSTMLPDPNFKSVLASKPLPFDRWTHVVLDVTAPAGGSLRIRLSLDGAQVLDEPHTVEGNIAVTDAFISFGLHNFNRPEPAFDVLYDNVVCRLE